MKLWIGGEVQVDVGDDFRLIRNHVQDLTNRLFEKKDYGNGVSELALIPMILGEHGPHWYKEVKRFHKKDRSAEFRLIIDYDEFKAADREAKTRLFCDMVLRSLSLLEEMDIADFDVAAVRRDFQRVARKNGWIA